MDKNFGMFYPENIVAGLTPLNDEEEKHMQARRKDLPPAPEIMDILFWLCHRSGAKNVVEIGVGHSTVPLILAAKRNGGRLFSTDIGVSHALVVPECADIWTCRLGIDSVEMGKQWSGGPIDFLYLDTSHLYDNTIKELETWMPHMKIGGWIVCHDVASCINTVFKAISDYIIKVNDVGLEYHHYPVGYGFGILIKRK